MSESADKPEREPGTPYPGGIDPELVALSRPRTRVGPLLSVSVVTFCLYTMVILWSDLVFSRQGAEAERVDDWRALQGGDYDNHFVELNITPDRSFAAHVAHGKSGVGGNRITPILGTEDQLWLYIRSDAWTLEAVAYDELYRGRVRQLTDLPFADALRSYLRAQPATPRFVDTEQVRAVLGAGASEQLTDPAGGALAVATNTPVAVVAVVPNQIELVAMATDDHPDAASWEQALRAADLLGPADSASTETEKAPFRFVAQTSDDVTTVRGKLVAAQLFAVTASQVTARHTGTWGKLAATDAGLGLGDVVVAWPQIRTITVAVQHAVPSTAVVLLATEQPSLYWYVLPLYLVMVLFAALFCFALYRTIRLRE